MTGGLHVHIWLQTQDENATLRTLLRHTILRDVPVAPAIPAVFASREAVPVPIPEVVSIILDMPEPAANDSSFSLGVYTNYENEGLQMMPGAAPTNITRSEYGLMAGMQFDNENVAGSINVKVGRASGSGGTQDWSTSLGTMNVALPDGYGVYVGEDGNPVQTDVGNFLTGNQDRAGLGTLDTTINSVALSPGDIDFSRGVESYRDYMSYGIGGNIYLKDQNLGFDANFDIMSGENASRHRLDLGILKGFENGSSLHVGVNAQQSEIRTNMTHSVTETPSGFHVLHEGNFSLDGNNTLNIAPAVIGERDLTYTDLEINPRTRIDEVPIMETIEVPQQVQDQVPNQVQVQEPNQIQEQVPNLIPNLVQQQVPNQIQDQVANQVPETETVCIRVDGRWQWVDRDVLDADGNPVLVDELDEDGNVVTISDTHIKSKSMVSFSLMMLK